MEDPVPKFDVSSEQTYRMIDKVRFETRLSYKLASHAVYVVLESLTSFGSPYVTSIVNEILKKLENPPNPANSLLECTEDMTRLFTISEKMDSIKNDSQQRSWELFDDRGLIMELLNELQCILTDADVAISKRFLFLNEFSIVSCLAEYYQMESRWPIKLTVLKILDLLCTMSRTVIVILLGTVLPLELTRDIENNYKDRIKLSFTMSVITKIFSIGETLPVIYFDTIGKDFILLLLRVIETPTGEPEHEDLIILLVNFILVYNLQFDDSKVISENITIQALQEAENPKIFSETLLLLFNRGKDPVKFLEHQPYPQNSILKIITDIFSNDMTSNLFYKNDIKVLIEILVRQLTDDSPAKIERNQWLKLIKQILLKTDESVYADRLQDLKYCVTQISDLTKNENTEESHLISEILGSLKIHENS